MCLCPGSALGRRSRTSPDDPYDEHKRQYGTSSHLAGGLLPSSVAGPYWRLYGRGADTETPQVGAGSLGFCRFSGLLVVFCGFPAGFPASRGLF